MPDTISTIPIAEINVGSTTAAAAVTLAILFFLCWTIAAVSEIHFSHMFMELFTDAPARSAAALGEGALWSIITGAIAGALGSAFYNFFAFLGRR